MAAMAARTGGERQGCVPLFTGDLNGDDVVTAADFALWRGGFDSIPPPDADGNGDISAADLLAWQGNFGCPWANQRA
jgi:hypothetical protein